MTVDEGWEAEEGPGSRKKGDEGPSGGSVGDKGGEVGRVAITSFFISSSFFFFPLKLFTWEASTKLQQHFA